MQRFIGLEDFFVVTSVLAGTMCSNDYRFAIFKNSAFRMRF